MTKTTWKPPNTKILRNACQLLFADSRNSTVTLLKTALARRKLIQDGGAKVQVTGHRSQVTGHRSQVTGHRSQVTGHRSQVTGHRSQVTGHRSQVTGHNKKYLWICAEFVFGFYSLFIPTNPTMSYFSKIPTSLRFQSVKSAFIKSFFSCFWSLRRVKRTDNILRKIVTFDAP